MTRGTHDFAQLVHFLRRQSSDGPVECAVVLRIAVTDLRFAGTETRRPPSIPPWTGGGTRGFSPVA
ncbi:MAG TPA: hypothetical protein VKU82_14145 [Planctomycetaceae bacterium]|nr:hypothetical protein [Planctomycetaceae bacterium]